MKKLRGAGGIGIGNGQGSGTVGDGGGVGFLEGDRLGIGSGLEAPTRVLILVSSVVSESV